MGVWSNLKGTTEAILGIGKARLDSTGLTAVRTHTLPDTSGTLALTSQLGGGAGLTKGTALLDFGTRSTEGTVVVASAAYASGTPIVAVDYTTTGDHSLAAHKWIASFVSFQVIGNPGVGFTIIGRSIYEFSGTFQVTWAY